MTSQLEELDMSCLNIRSEQGSLNDGVLVSVQPKCEAFTTGLEAIPDISKQRPSRAPVLDLPNRIVREYLREHNPAFCELDDLRVKGWNDVKSEKHFERLRESADNPDTPLQQAFYEMNKKLGIELHDSTGAFGVRSPGGARAKALNLCMAPGGYTWYFLKRFPKATVKGITLSTDEGGHPMYLPHGDNDPRVEVIYMDITMMAAEFGTLIEDIPAQHPEAAKFTADRPLLGEAFELVVCDGQALRTHQHERSREREAVRLLVAQLIFGLNRIKPGGTLIILLHKVDAWDSILLLKTFETFSKIRLYKPKKIHAARSSFYLIAKDVQPDSAQAIQAIEKWKTDWWRATFGGEAGTGLDKAESEENEVKRLLDDYGDRVMKIGTPIWSIQLQSMKTAKHFSHEG